MKCQFWIELNRTESWTEQEDERLKSEDWKEFIVKIRIFDNDFEKIFVNVNIKVNISIRIRISYFVVEANWNQPNERNKRKKTRKRIVKSQLWIEYLFDDTALRLSHQHDALQGYLSLWWIKKASSSSEGACLCLSVPLMSLKSWNQSNEMLLNTTTVHWIAHCCLPNVIHIEMNTYTSHHSNIAHPKYTILTWLEWKNWKNEKTLGSVPFVTMKNCYAKRHFKLVYH